MKSCFIYLGIYYLSLFKFEWMMIFKIWAHYAFSPLGTCFWNVIYFLVIQLTLVPERCGCNLELVIFKFTSKVDILSISCELALRWMPQDFTDDKSTLAQVMAWCRQVTSHYLDQSRPTSISTYGVARPQWVKTLIEYDICYRLLHYMIWNEIKKFIEHDSHFECSIWEWPTVRPMCPL